MNSVVDRIIAEKGREKKALIPILQAIQKELNYLPEEALRQVSAQTEITAADIYSVASFYAQFRMQPVGKHMIKICVGTACHVKGSAKVLENITHRTGVEPGRTSRDGQFSIEVVACMGACALAPAVNVNGNFHPKVSPTKVDRLIQ